MKRWPPWAHKPPDPGPFLGRGKHARHIRLRFDLLDVDVTITRHHHTETEEVLVMAKDATINPGSSAHATLAVIPAGTTVANVSYSSAGTLNLTPDADGMGVTVAAPSNQGGYDEVVNVSAVATDGTVLTDQITAHVSALPPPPAATAVDLEWDA